MWDVIAGMCRRNAGLVVVLMLPMEAFGVEQTDATIKRQREQTPEVVVTAQKREERLQDVPIVVTTVSEQLLRDNGVRDIKGLAIAVPGLSVTSSSNEAFTTARIRGVGTVGDNLGLESSVGVVIDGIYRPRNGVAFSELGEMERIEVLRGPQGTVFGKNTSAGVINVVTKKPSFDFGSTAEVSAGNYGDIEASASVTGPVSRIVAGRLFAVSRERDGFLKVNRGPGPRAHGDDNDVHLRAVRGQLLLQPSEKFDMRMSTDYSEREEHCCVPTQAVLTPVTGVLQVLNALQPGSFGNPATPFNRIGYANRDTRQSVLDRGVALDVNWRVESLGDAVLTSLTGWRDWRSINGQDADFTAVDILYRDSEGGFENEFRQVSEELRLAGTSSRLKWLVGFFAADERLNSRDQIVFGSQFQQYFNLLLSGALSAFPSSAYPADGATDDIYRQTARNWAIFTNNTYRLTDAWEATMGVRYTNESKDLRANYSNLHGGVGCSILRSNSAFVNNASAATIFGIGCSAIFADPLFNNAATRQSLSENAVSGTAKLTRRLGSTSMGYVSYSRGYKAGGFNLYRERNGDPRFGPASGNPAAVSVDSDTRFNKEVVDSYEIGVKSQWADTRLTVNGALFHQSYKDFQLNTFTGLQFVVTALPKVVSKGVDLEALWHTPIDRLSMQGGLTYADTTIEEFGPAIAFFRPERDGDTLSYAPRWSSAVSATYERGVSARLGFRASVGARYTSKYNTGSNLDPRKVQPSMTLVNARVGIGSLDESWVAEVWANNLTAVDYYQLAIDASLQGSSAGAVPTSTIDAYLGPPRTYGLTIRMKF